jgi:hypothetical protein
MQRTALRAAADAERCARRSRCEKHDPDSERKK